MQELKNFIYKMIEEKKGLDDEKLKRMKREYAKKNKLSGLPTNIQLINIYKNLLKENKIKEDRNVENILKKRGVRSMSGIVPIQVLTKPFPCPGKCIFCPNDITMPKSYINTEPGAMRAFLNDFDPIKQAYNRLLSLYITGHDTDKIEMIVLGGTWDFYPSDYKKWFIKSLFDACNTFPEFLSNTEIKTDNPKSARFTVNKGKINVSSTLEKAQKKNETAKHRIIGLTIETRPEYVTHKNCKLWRRLGVTRIEIGLQNLDDEILKKNKRGHTVNQIEQALHRLRQYGFKFSAHFMPGLLGSDPEKDIDTIKKAFQNIYIKPDEIKFYPTSVLPNTELYQLYKKGEYRPINTEELRYIIKKIKYNYIPPFTRIKRLIRDIPSTEIVAGSNITNLRQIVLKEIKDELFSDIRKRTKQYERLKKVEKIFSSVSDFLYFLEYEDRQNIKDYKTFVIGNSTIDYERKRNFVCLCTRCREIKNKEKLNSKNAEELIIIRKYFSSVGEEYFISIEDNLGYLYGFARLLLPYDDQIISWKGLKGETSLIRELHVYGKVAQIDKKSSYLQHTGIGGKIMKLSEEISYTKGYKRISVISGIGVRGYYRKLGFVLEGTYMKKTFKKDP